MLNDPSHATRVMLVTGHLENGGGVGVFSELLMSRLSSRFSVDHVEVGARNTVAGDPLDPGVVPMVRRLVSDFVMSARLFQRRKHQIIHLNPSLQTKALLRDGVFLLFLRMVGFRGAIVFYRGWSPELAKRIKSSPILQKAFRLAFGWVPCSIVLSETFSRYLTDIGFAEDRVVTSSTMFNGKALQEATKHAEQTKFGTGERTFRLLFMSRVERNKGIFELIDAVAELSAQYPRIHLTVAGDGSALLEAKRHTKEVCMSERISFLGFVQSPYEKAKLMCESDVFCLPTSHDEGMPVSLLEAMGAGLAVISTPVGGIPEACGPDGAILLPEPTTPALAAAIRKLHDNPEFCHLLQTNNRSRAWKLYEASVVVRNIESIYLAVAGDTTQGWHLTPTDTAASA